MTEPKKRRTVKQLISTIQARVDRDVELLNKESSELSQVKGQLDLLGGMRRETQAKFDVVKQTHGELSWKYRERSARVQALRDLLKDFEKNGDEE